MTPDEIQTVAEGAGNFAEKKIAQFLFAVDFMKDETVGQVDDIAAKCGQLTGTEVKKALENAFPA